MNGQRFFFNLFAFLSITLAIGANAAPALSAPNIEIIPASAASGVQMSWGACPCFRWTVQAKLASGGVETHDFLISTEALFKIREEFNPDFMRWKKRLFTVGALEALWKGGHVGVGFEGVTFGEDRDHGYSDLLRMGLYGLLNLVLNDAARLDIRSAVELQALTPNLGTRVQERSLNESANFRWQTGLWSGQVNAHVAIDSADFTDRHLVRYGGEIATRMKMLSWHDLELGLSFDLAAEHDPFRALLGMYDNEVSASLLMDLSYVAGPNVIR